MGNIGYLDVSGMMSVLGVLKSGMESPFTLQAFSFENSRYWKGGPKPVGRHVDYGGIRRYHVSPLIQQEDA